MGLKKGLAKIFCKKKIKGNIKKDGTKIYYVPEHRLYDAVAAERWFKTIEDAEKAGFRAPKR